MIFVLKGQEGVEGCINGGGDAICAKRTEGIQFDHLIFEFLPAVAVDEIFELLQVKNCEAFAMNCARHSMPLSGVPRKSAPYQMRSSSDGRTVAAKAPRC